MALQIRLLCLAVILTFAHTGFAEVWELHFKSPAPGMRFTAGLTIQMWADIIPRDDNHPGFPQAECRWDGEMVGARVNANLKAYDYFPFTVPADKVTPGTHKLTLSGFTFSGKTSPPETSLSLEVDPWPKDKTLVELKEDMKAADLNWTNVAVRGNGHTLTVSGKMTIKNSLITGLGSMKIEDPAKSDAGAVVMVPGITGSLNGDIVIEDSIFEATGAVNLTLEGTAGASIKNNEFRASNYIKFVPWIPDCSPVVQITGKGGAQKIFSGNKIGSGLLAFNGCSGWLIGGETDAESNILMGPRCVLSLSGCRDMHVIGNYIHHDYRGTWSQGYNFSCGNCETILAEHNILRQGSWPLQSFSGEFRYNLMVDAGHNWVRTLTTGTQFHHNLLVHTGDPYSTGTQAGIWLYNNCKNVAIYSNTMDGGGTQDFNCPMISLSTGCSLSTLRNNIFTGSVKIITLYNNAVIARGSKESDSEPRVAYADYNCFFTPQAADTPKYDPNINEKKDAGAHDIQADPMFAKGKQIPYSVNEADMWNRKLKVSDVLAQYRERYAPVSGSPVIGKGDPADGKDSFVGAIGPAGCTRADDKFGKFSPKEKAGK